MPCTLFVGFDHIYIQPHFQKSTRATHVKKQDHISNLCVTHQQNIKSFFVQLKNGVVIMSTNLEGIFYFGLFCIEIKEHNTMVNPPYWIVTHGGQNRVPLAFINKTL
jgi:hypothetical protein